MNSNCPFCNLPSERAIDCCDLTQTLRDGFPISPGHTLIIPKRHFGTYFQATSGELQAISEAINSAKILLDDEFAPDGYNIGINNGAAAGQTVFHLHVHLIPRYDGDTEDPRGGVRWIFPEKADYWSHR